MVNKEYQQFNIEFRRPQVLRYAMPGAKPHALRDDERWVRTELAGPTNENMTGEFSLSMPYNNESPGPGWNVIGSIQKSSVYPLGNTPAEARAKIEGLMREGRLTKRTGNDEAAMERWTGKEQGGRHRKTKKSKRRARKTRRSYK
jgi:hypothetical protein